MKGGLEEGDTRCMEASEGALRRGWVRGDKDLETERKVMNSRNT